MITKQIFEQCRKDPVLFVSKVLGATPHPGQEQLLRGIKKRTVIRAGRQWGKSTVLAWYVTWFLCYHPGKTVLIVAPTVEQTKVIFNEVAKIFRGPLSFMLRKKITEAPFPTISLINNAECTGRGASSPEFIRGKPVHLIVCDETSFFRDDVIKYVLLPMLTVTGQQEDSGIIMISTPFGGGEFHDQYFLCERKMQEGDNYYASYHFTSLDNPHADKRYLQEIKDEEGEESLIWQTEYLAEFADSDLSVFSTQDIKAAVNKYPYESFPIQPIKGHRYVQGVDLANRSDYFVSTIFDVTNPDLVVLVNMTRHQRKGWDFNKETIRRQHQLYNNAKTLIDSSTLGESVLEDLKDINAEGLAISSNTIKWDLIHSLVRMLQEHRLALPHLPEVERELRYFSYQITKAKNVKMEARKGHDDIVLSLAFSAYLASRPLLTGFFHGIRFGMGRRKATENIEDDTEEQPKKIKK